MHLVRLGPSKFDMISEVILSDLQVVLILHFHVPSCFTSTMRNLTRHHLRIQFQWYYTLTHDWADLQDFLRYEFLLVCFLFALIYAWKQKFEQTHFTSKQSAVYQNVKTISKQEASCCLLPLPVKDYHQTKHKTKIINIAYSKQPHNFAWA